MINISVDGTFWDISIYRYNKNEKSTSLFWVCRYRNRVQLFYNNSLGLEKLWNANFDFWFLSRWKSWFFVKNEWDATFWDISIYRYNKNGKSTSLFWVCRYRNRVQLFSNNSLGLGKLWNANFDFWFYSRWKPWFFVKNDQHFGGWHILRYIDISI